MTETMEVIHGIRNITPDAITTTAILVDVHRHLCLYLLRLTLANTELLGQASQSSIGMSRD